jgi:hypothetical protein
MILQVVRLVRLNTSASIDAVAVVVHAEELAAGIRQAERRQIAV